VPTEMEAAELVGYLEQFGIEAYSQDGGTASWLDAIDAGAHRIFVHAADLERAQQALADAK
jgi:putative signal transducing protein